MKVASQHAAGDKGSKKNEIMRKKNDKQRAGTHWSRHSWDFPAPSSAAELQGRPESGSTRNKRKALKSRALIVQRVLLSCEL